MVLAWNLSFGVEIRFWRGIQVSPPGSGKENVLGRDTVLDPGLCELTTIMEFGFRRGFLLNKKLDSFENLMESA